LIAIVLLAAGWIFRPSPRFNRTNIAAELLSLKEPLLDVRIDWFLDGGSFEIVLVGQDGTELKCELPVSDTPVPEWNRILVSSGGVFVRELPFVADNKAYVIRLIERYAGRDEMKMKALIELRGIERDYISAFFYRLEIE
jgi:hypothetical protein